MNALMVHTIVHAKQNVVTLLEVLLVLANLVTGEMGSAVQVNLYEITNENFL